MSQNHRDFRPRGWHAALILLLMASYMAVAPWSAVSGDFSRDLRIASDIVAGTDYPLLGPILASNFHLGPVWFYFLAALQWAGLGYFGTVVLIALIGSLQFPLAYMGGRCWFNPGTGLLWALLLLVPAWGFYEQIFPGHTSLTVAMAAAMLLFSGQFLRHGGFGALLGMAASASLAVHAHPTCLLLMPIPVVCLAWGWHRHRPGSAMLLLAALVALLPFAPIIIHALTQQASLLSALGAYAGSEQGGGSLWQLPDIAWALSGGPVHYWLATVAGWPALAALALAWLWTILLVVGLGGAARLAMSGHRGACLMLATLALAVLVLALGRAIFPFYMWSAVRCLLLLVVASGLIHCLRGRAVKRPLLDTAAAALASYWLIAIPAISHQHQGNWPFAFAPLFATTFDWQQPEPLALTTALGARHGGRWLCRHPEVVMHGAWAQMQIISYGMERRLACRAGPQSIGGSDPSRPHWLGLSRALLNALEIEPQVKAGNFGLFPASQVIGPGRELLLPDDLADPPDPPLPTRFGEAETWVTQLQARPGEYLALSQLSFGLSTRPELEIRCGESLRSAAAADSVTRIYTDLACDQPLTISLHSPDLATVDLVLFSPTGPGPADRQD